MARTIEHFFGRLSKTLNSYFYDRDFEREKAAFMNQLPDMLREGHKGEFTIFYQGKPLGYYKNLSDIDFDAVRKSIKYKEDALVVTRIMEEYLKYGFGRTSDPKEHERPIIRRMPSLDGIESTL